MRTFSDATYSELARKPEHIREARTCHLHDTDPSSFDLVELIGPVTIGQLDALVKQRGREANVDFAVRDGATEDIFLVNTEGADYTRYLGRFTTRDAREIVEVKAAEGDLAGEEKGPLAEFIDFIDMPKAMYEGYQGCEGRADIAFVTPVNQDNCWQFDIVVDDGGVQVHYIDAAGRACTWGLTFMGNRDIALAIGRRAGQALVDNDVPMDESAQYEDVTEVLERFGMVRF